MNNAMIMTSPRSKRRHLGAARSPTKTRGITLPSLTYPTGKRVNITASELHDESDTDLSPRPPSAIRNCIQRLRNRYAGQNSQKQWKKTSSAKSPGKPTKSPNQSLTSPNYKERNDKRLSMLRSAIEEQESQNVENCTSITELVEIERSCRIQQMVQEQDGRTGVFRLFMGIETKVMRSHIPAFALLEEEEEVVRGEFVADTECAIMSQWSTFQQMSRNTVQTAERGGRVVVLQEEMSQRSLLFGAWLGLDTSSTNALEPEEMEMRQQIVVDEGFMREQWIQRNVYFEKFAEQNLKDRRQRERCDTEKTLTSKKYVMLESEENHRIRVVQSEEASRKQVLHVWLMMSAHTEFCAGEKTERPPSVPQPTTGLRPRKSPVDLNGITVNLDIRKGSSDLTLKAALKTAMSAVMLSEESTRMEFMAVEKKERGSLRIALSPRRLRQRSNPRNGSRFFDNAAVPKPPPYHPSQVLAQFADNPRLYGAMLRVLSKEMALVQQHAKITRGCDERSELAERHRLVFKFWKTVHSSYMSVDEKFSLLMEEEAMLRHGLEMQEDNNMILTVWKHHSIFEKNFRHGRCV